MGPGRDYLIVLRADWPQKGVYYLVSIIIDV